MLQIIFNMTHIYCVFQAEEKSKYELMGSCGQQRLLPEAEGETDTMQSTHPTRIRFHLFSSYHPHKRIQIALVPHFVVISVPEQLKRLSSLQYLWSTHWEWIKWMRIRIALNPLLSVHQLKWVGKNQSAKAKRGNKNLWRVLNNRAWTVCLNIQS